MKRFMWMSCTLAILALVIGCSDNKTTDKSDDGGTKSNGDGKNGGSPVEPAVKVIDGVSDGGNKWTPKETSVKTGDTVRWVSKSGFSHGVIFTNWSVAKDILEVTGGIEIKPMPQFGADAHGTDGKSPGTEGFVLVEAKIKEFPSGVTEIPFICTIHGPPMDGKLVVDAGNGGG